MFQYQLFDVYRLAWPGFLFSCIQYWWFKSCSTTTAVSQSSYKLISNHRFSKQKFKLLYKKISLRPNKWHDRSEERRLMQWKSQWRSVSTVPRRKFFFFCNYKNLFPFKFSATTCNLNCFSSGTTKPKH